MGRKCKKIVNESEEDTMLNELFVPSPIRRGFVEIGDEKFVLPIYYQDEEENIDKFEVRRDDIFITGHPRTGTTWLYQMVELIVTDFDYEVTHISVAQRIKQLEVSAMFDSKKIYEDMYYDIGEKEIIEQLPSPRIFRSHLSFNLLPEQIRNGAKKPKILHIAREPKDACVSGYYNSKMLNGYKGNLDQYCRLFLAGKYMFGPFFANILSYWKERHRANLLYLTYSEMKRDLHGTIRKVANFLGKVITEDQIANLARFISFDSMKKNSAFDLKPMTEIFFGRYGLSITDGITIEETHFIRSGKEGEGREKMSSEMVRKFDEWTLENLPKENLKEILGTTDPRLTSKM